MRFAGTANRAAAVLLLAASVAWALAVPDAPQGRVSDYAGLLAPAERGALEARLASVERESGNQIAVAIFDSLEGESLEEFSIALAEKWKIGQAGKDNGIILVVFPKDRKVRIEVGYGLEERVTDALSGRIIRDVLAPPFREGRYAAGLTAAADALARAARGDDPHLPAETGRGRGSPPPFAFALGIIALSFVSIFSRLFRHRYTDVGGGRTAQSRSVFFWPGGFGGGGGGGFGGGGGGFSGGGGGFGGGGASGGW